MSDVPTASPTPNPRLAKLGPLIRDAEATLDTLLEERYLIVADDFERGCSPSEVARAAGVARQRIYELRKRGEELRRAG